MSFKFQQLDPKAQNVCYLHSSDKSILAQNSIAKYQGDDINEFKKFAKKHKKHLLIGYLSYDLCYQLYNIKQTAKDDLKLPKILFFAFDKWQELKNQNPPTTKLKAQTKHNFKPTISRKQYDQAYKKIKDYIKEGDIYQINLTHRLEAESKVAPRTLFQKILEKNPVQYAAYIETPEFQVLSASPERFIKITDNKIQTSPIKGTRPRGKTAKQDQQLQKELIESEKEAAELNMITDLLRNDIGQVSKTGTVKVQGHRLLQKCPTVWHTYSDIIGEIKTSPLEALISMIPGGSITGCPKKRAIEIIDELEPNTRGIYTGNIGYIHPNGNLDFNIAIRTVIKKHDKLYLQVGGGIVLDSTSKSEYQETLDKAASFMDIL